ncbi:MULTISPECIES: hypothetical protein [unclassified Moraxella]|uniref:hypothetical protein n=1 Tax=unclassified Moraxella TaxID=2685852 RepID=UPI002B410174|nr:MULTISPECIES: hypothetical protein [unclassified Moraxella]
MKKVIFISSLTIATMFATQVASARATYHCKIDAKYSSVTIENLATAKITADSSSGAKSIFWEMLQDQMSKQVKDYNLKKDDVVCR